MIARLVASALGAGFLPGAPGTWGSLLALGLGVPLMLFSPLALPLAAAVATLAGFWAVRALRAGDDPGWVVIDEVAGQWIAMLPLARPGLAGLAGAFLLFRLLDVLKPGPIGWADRRGGPDSVMIDDLIAGAAAGGVLWAVGSRWPGALG